MFHVYGKTINIQFYYSSSYSIQLLTLYITCIFLRDENMDSRNNGYVTIFEI